VRLAVTDRFEQNLSAAPTAVACFSRADGQFRDASRRRAVFAISQALRRPARRLTDGYVVKQLLWVGADAGGLRRVLLTTGQASGVQILVARPVETPRSA
jgi:hypothetical protein